jgi:hypothetical protein
MIIFLFQALLYSFISMSMLSSRPGKILILFLIITFLINQTLFLLYGIVTGQIGFILNVVFQLFLILFVQMYILSTAKEVLEENYEDN